VYDGKGGGGEAKMKSKPQSVIPTSKLRLIKLSKAKG